jgi:hypothetical protein
LNVHGGFLLRQRVGCKDALDRRERVHLARGEIAQLVATYLTEREQGVYEPSVQHEVCSSGKVLFGRE